MNRRREYPEDVGILLLDAYFPKKYIDQGELETYLGVSAGKLTIGLGQSGMAYVDDREDIYSICLSAVSSFMAKYNIVFADIGRLEVASETIQDHSKSIKSVLMQLFENSGNSDVEGIDSMNACYAGTNALFNSVAWVESRAWDGRYAMVVAADIAEYAEGAARPTGGCGAVVFLIGEQAPLVIDPVRASHMEHAYDFYKPHLSSPYPVVNGKYSNVCYLRSLDRCLHGWAKKTEKQKGLDKETALYTKNNCNDVGLDANSSASASASTSPSLTPLVSSTATSPLLASDYYVFHAPYNKLVQKSFGRLYYNDFLLDSSKPEYKECQMYKKVTEEDSYANRSLEKAFVAVSKSTYAEKVAPSTLLPKNIGNTYTASLYAGLLSLVYNKGASLAGKSIMCFSYGSGLASSLFTISVSSSPASVAQLKKIQEGSDLEQRLAQRRKMPPAHLKQTLQRRESLHSLRAAFCPASSCGQENMFGGAYYLDHKDEHGRRVYKRASSSITDVNSSSNSSGK